MAGDVCGVWRVRGACESGVWAWCGGAWWIAEVGSEQGQAGCGVCGTVASERGAGGVVRA